MRVPEVLEAPFDMARIPALPAVFLVHAAEDAPYLARSASLRRRLGRLLAQPERMSRRLMLGGLATRVEYWVLTSRLESSLLPKKPIRRGHVVVFKYPEDPARDFIKRVVGLPGETVEIRNKVVYIDGKPLDEPYVRFLSPPLRPEDPEYGRGDGRDNWGPEVVPAGRLLVLGDNRDNSKDSRYWGFLPIDQVKGRALLVYWSADGDDGRVRWERMGKLVP